MNKHPKNPRGLPEPRIIPDQGEPAQEMKNFPAAWSWLVDEAIPTWVKLHYSPQESWKEKPFAKEDTRFFFKGIEELSEAFTEDRGRSVPTYFAHPKFRSGYLLYFLPLQAAKFLALFQLHPKAFEAALDHGRKQGVLRVIDLGAGPGTASIAFLLALLDKQRETREALPPIEFDWFDTQRDIMLDGAGLVKQLAESFPSLRGKVTVRTHVAPWWKATSDLNRLGDHHPRSLVLLGHVLNEATGPHRKRGMETNLPTDLDAWSAIKERAHGGGLLIVEPALRSTSQFVSKLRDEMLRTEMVPAIPASIWGPCLHAGNCPMAEGRDWCHFSVPAQIPGTWFREFSKGLGSERQWLKFAYLWFASEDHPAPSPPSRLRRVVSDPISTGNPFVLTCEPETPGKVTVPPKAGIFRGSLITLDAQGALKRPKA